MTVGLPSYRLLNYVARYRRVRTILFFQFADKTKQFIHLRFSLYMRGTTNGRFVDAGVLKPYGCPTRAVAVRDDGRR